MGGPETHIFPLTLENGPTGDVSYFWGRGGAGGPTIESGGDALRRGTGPPRFPEGPRARVGCGADGMFFP